MRGLTVIFLAQHFKNDLGLSTFMVGVAVTAMLAGGVIGPIAFGWISDRTSRKRVTQVSLVLSAIASLWLAFQGAFLPSLLTSLIFYGIVTRSRMTLTLSLVADSLPDEDRDAAFSVFSFLGFASAPFWILLIARLMDGPGFTVAFSIVALSFLAEVVVMAFVVDPQRSSQMEAQARG